MSFIADVENEIRSLIALTITAAELTNIYVATKAAKINILEKAKSGEITGDQFWIVEAGEATPDEEWGADNSAYRCPLQIMQFIKQTGSEVKDNIRTDLTTIEQAMRGTGFDTFLLIENGVIDTSVSDPAVASILDKTMPWAAGTLYFTPGLLCGEFV